MSRRALCSAGSLRVGSPASSLHRRAPTPRRPSRRASLPSLDGTAAIQRPETARSPKFLDDLSRTCPGSSTPAEPREQDLRDWPSLRIAPPVLPSEPSVSSASATWTFRGPFPQPARSLSTLRGHGHPCASLQPRKTRFRLAVLPWPGGSPYPLGRATRFQLVLGLHGLPPGRGFSWRTEGRPRRDARGRTGGPRRQLLGYRRSGPVLPSML